MEEFHPWESYDFGSGIASQCISSRFVLVPGSSRDVFFLFCLHVCLLVVFVLSVCIKPNCLLFISARFFVVISLLLCVLLFFFFCSFFRSNF